MYTRASPVEMLYLGVSDAARQLSTGLIQCTSITRGGECTYLSLRSLQVSQFFNGFTSWARQVGVAVEDALVVVVALPEAVVVVAVGVPTYNVEAEVR